MSRGRSTPYGAQMRKFLAGLNGDHLAFSAASLEDQFEHPRNQKRGTNIGGIHKALMKAFSEGTIISFADASGSVLREPDVVVPGSKAIGQPQIFGTPGTPSPTDGYAPVTYEQLTHHEPAGDIENPADEASPADDDVLIDADATGDAEAAATEGDHDQPAASDLLHNDEDDSVARAQRSADAMRTFTAYLKDPPAQAPDWVPTAALREWASTPTVVGALRKVVLDGPMPDRLALIQAGVSRKGQISSTSAAARGVAQLCRRPGPFWRDVVCGAAKQYIDDEAMAPPDELASFVEDPASLYIDRDIAPHVLLLWGVALGLDGAVLADLVSACEESVPEDDLSAAPAEERISQLESLQADSKKALKQAEKDLRAAHKKIDTLNDSLRRARETAHEHSGDELVAEQEARQAAESGLADARSQIEELTDAARRVEELEATLAVVQRSRDALLAEDRSIEKERQLRAQIEAQFQEQMGQIGDLRAQLRAENVLPTADGPSLLRALSRPIGDATRQAAERLAEGRSAAGDEQLMAFAATVMQTLTAMQQPAPAPPLAESAPLAQPPTEVVVEPEFSSVSEQAAKAASLSDAELADPPETRLNDPADESADAAPTPRRRPRRPTSWFTVRPVGGAGEIGGSAILIETPNHHRVLLDAGQRVKGEYGQSTTHQFHRGVRGVDHLHGILVSHAHIDHVGSLPPLWDYHSTQQDAEVPVWMTAPTKELARIMLKDSAKIQNARQYERDTLAESDFASDAMEAAYTEAQVNEVLNIVETPAQHEPVPIPGTSLVARFLPVSHVLGSCAIHLTDNEWGHTLLYTGDLGPLGEPQLTLPSFGTDQLLPAETVIMESTYGSPKDADRELRRTNLHGRERAIRTLLDVSEKALDRGGFVLLPSFSLGRTQELVRVIGEHMKSPRIYLAGMGETIFEVYDQYLRKENGFWVRPGDYPDTDPIGRRMRGRTIEEKAEEVLAGENGFIIASPAMLSGGWSRTFMERMITDSRHAIVFSGYLPRHGTGIMKLREFGKYPITIDDRQVKVQCDVKKVGLSAHAPFPDLSQFARDVAAGHDHVNFGLVHGEMAAQRELAAEIGQRIEHADAKSLSNGEPWSPQRP